MTVPPAEETVFTPDSDLTVVELDPPGDVVDVEELPDTDVDDVDEVELVELVVLVELVELVEGSRLVDDEVLAVDVVALMTSAPGASLTSFEAAATTAQVAAVTRIVAASHPRAYRVSLMYSLWPCRIQRYVSRTSRFPKVLNVGQPA